MSLPSLRAHPEFSPCRASKVDKIGFFALLIGHDFRGSDGVYRANFHAGLCSTRSSTLPKIRSIGTEVTLLGFLNNVIPLHTLGGKRASLDASLAANAELLIDHT
jgi:hypothetical protein